MNKISIILFLLFLNSCSDSSSIRKDISGVEFKNSEVKSIIIKEIEHPLLGGVINTKKLNSTEKKTFLNEIDNLEKKGIAKCRSNYIISVLLESDTLKFKYCNGSISQRKNDIYYSIKNNKEFNKILPQKLDSINKDNSIKEKYFNCDTLIGIWGVGSFYGIMGNIPPMIRFAENGKGEIQFAENNEKINWECKGEDNLVKITSVDGNNSHIISGNYIITNESNDEYIKYSLKFEDDKKLVLSIGRPK